MTSTRARHELRDQGRQSLGVPQRSAFDQLQIDAGGESAPRELARDDLDQPAGDCVRIEFSRA